MTDNHWWCFPNWFMDKPILQKIPVAELKLGMFLHELCGAWLDHPFWKTRFVLNRPADLAKLRDSGITHCWIDAAKSLGQATENTREAPAQPSTPSAAGVAPTLVSPPAPMATSMEEELRRATAVMRKSRQAVRALFTEARMGRALDIEKCMPMVDDIAASVWRNPGAIITLARLKTHDDYTYIHSVAVCALMVALARQLGHDDGQVRAAGMAGLLHDIGKACLPIELLNKPGKLSSDEYRLMQEHPQRGHHLLSESGTAGALVMDVCLHHHERPDGKGYPHGLAGSDLSLPARMGAVCDVYDAITSNRPYKIGWDPGESLSRMAQWVKNGQFDDAVFQAFAKSLGIYPVGTLVRLQSGRLGVVVSQDPDALLTPTVKVFFSTRSEVHIPPEVVDLAHANCSDRIVGREPNDKWKFRHIDELWAGANVLHMNAR
ncbi:MAG: HD-GYP domain-containing protein [Burkholderiaceae bacterium]